MYDIIIVGMGISGITAAIYAKRSNKKVLLLDKGMPGGLLNSIDKISNYPGLVDIKGMDFAASLEDQVKSLNIEYKLEEVTGVDLGGTIKKIITKSGEYEAKNVIFALGRTPKYLGINRETDLLGRGVSTCATCDAYFYKDKDVAVVGTGNSALQESLYLSNIVKHVYILNRRANGFKGDEILIDQVNEKENITVLYGVNVRKLNEKDNKLDSIVLDNEEVLPVSGLFIYIGNVPATSFLPKEILDDDGYINVDKSFKTPVPNVYAIGDCIKKDMYQLVTAAADGAKVIKAIK